MIAGLSGVGKAGEDAASSNTGKEQEGKGSCLHPRYLDALQLASPEVINAALYTGNAKQHIGVQSSIS